MKSEVKKLESGLEARLVALRLLSCVIDKKTSLDGLTDEVGGNAHYRALDVRDRRLVRAILVTCLRHYGTIEAAIGRFLKNPLPKGAPSLRHLLYLTAAQILYLDIPDYASINLAVSIAKSDPRLRRFAPLVNAVTRQVGRNKQILANEMVGYAPLWFREMLEHDFGHETMQAILQIHTKEPPLDLTVKENPNQWAEKLSAICLPNGTLRLKPIEQNLTEIAGFAQGMWWVQDVAASLPALLMGAAEGKTIADICAAPGGKTAQLAHFGAKIHAFDVSKNRMQRLRQNMERLNLNIETHDCDVRKYSPKYLFDAVLCDVPCSSTGTCRRHPDILWTKSPDDIEKLVSIQIQLLETAIKWTKAGGIIVFSNCSLHHREGEDLIAHFLAVHPEVKLSPIHPHELPSDFASLITRQGFLRSTPADLAQFGGMDGFFAARLEKI